MKLINELGISPTPWSRNGEYLAKASGESEAK